MLQRVWNVGKWVVLGLAALVATAYFILLPLSRHAQYHAEAESRRSIYDQAAQEIIEYCSVFPVDIQLECLTERIGGAQENYRGENDLAAQRTMAIWTSAIGIVAIIGLPLTVVGVGLIAATFKETRGATNHAKRQADIAEASFRGLERPYLFPKILATWQLDDVPDIPPGVPYTLVNYGKTPAITHQIFAELVPISKLRFKGGVPIIADDADIEEWYEIVPVGGELNNPKFAALEGGNPGGETLVLHCHILYRDPSRSATYTHHFTLHRLGKNPFRLEYSKHQTLEPDYSTQGGGN